MGGSDRTRLLLYAGRLSLEKKIRLLVDMMLVLLNADATRQAQDYRLLVAGRGPLEQWLQEQAQHLSGRIVLLGHLASRKALAELLANADAFIHPNPREPFGITPLEAMCSELPLVAPLKGGVMDYCSAQNAWLAEPDGPSFAASLHACLDDQVTRAARVIEGRRTALAHDWDEIAGRFLDTYDSFYRSHRAEQTLA